MITASHSLSKYNGYKIYDADGCVVICSSSTETRLKAYINLIAENKENANILKNNRLKYYKNKK